MGGPVGIHRIRSRSTVALAVQPNTSSLGSAQRPGRLLTTLPTAVFNQPMQRQGQPMAITETRAMARERLGRRQVPSLSIESWFVSKVYVTQPASLKPLFIFEVREGGHS